MKNKDILLLINLFILLPTLLLTSCNVPLDKINSSLIADNNSALYANFPKTRTLGIKWDKNPVDDDINPPQPVVIDGWLEGIVTEPLYRELASVTDPVVVKYGNGYRMWYTLIVTLNHDVDGLYTSYSIRCAESAEGSHWTDITDVSSGGRNVPLLKEESAGGARVCSVTVLKDSDDPGLVQYRMWYLGKRERKDWGEGSNIDQWTLYYADSIDGGRSWETGYLGGLYKAIESTPEKFDEYTIKRASVVTERNEQGEIALFKMWYSGINNLGRGGIGYASSTSGTEGGWQKDFALMGAGFAAKSNFDELSLEYPFVMKDEGVYKMWYSGYTMPWSIGLAYSLDGKSFDYYDNQFDGADNSAVLKPEVFWEDRGVMNCHVIEESDDDGNPFYKMWYVGKGKDNVYKIGYARSVKSDE